MIFPYMIPGLLLALELCAAILVRAEKLVTHTYVVTIRSLIAHATRYRQKFVLRIR